MQQAMPIITTSQLQHIIFVVQCIFQALDLVHIYQFYCPLRHYKKKIHFILNILELSVNRLGACLHPLSPLSVVSHKVMEF